MTRTSQVSRKFTVVLTSCLAAVSLSVSLRDTSRVADFYGFSTGVSQSVSLSCLDGAAGVSTVSVSLDRDSETARENGTFLRFSRWSGVFESVSVIFGVSSGHLRA